MSSDEDDLEKNIENAKNSVHKAFARISANLKARELETLRQLNAIRIQCKVNEELKRNCVHNLHISYETESKLVDSINSYGTIDFERLQLDGSLLTSDVRNISNTFGDELYSLNCIGDYTCEEQTENVATKGAIPMQHTLIDNCTCNLNTMNGDANSNTSRKGSDAILSSADSCTDNTSFHGDSDRQSIENKECDKQRKNSVKKKEPTDDWLESIKTETDAEPLARDMMEHINISEP